MTDEAIGNKQQGLKLLEFFCGHSLGVVVGLLISPSLSFHPFSSSGEMHVSPSHREEKKDPIHSDPINRGPLL